ncbi:MAG TPA: oxidoreductase [Candidatus Binatia bacterium]|nr:oxidoreductase [Candidatus Binatia bacterium]
MSATLPRQEGRVALVTGANRGLGLEIASGLVRAGATVVLGCRDAARAETAAESLRRATPGARVQTLALDMAELAAVRVAAEEFRRRFGALHLLVHNAAAILAPYGKTRDGFETQVGVNHLAAFALTGRLLEALVASGDGRVVLMSSLAHRMTKGLDLGDLHYERTPYQPMDAYGRSKLAVLLFAFELDRRLKRAGLPVKAVAAHPGWSNTNPDHGGFFMRLANRLMAQPPAMGALPALHAATTPELQGGEYFGPGGLQELRGSPKRVQARAEASDPALGAQLWSLAENLTGVRYLEPGRAG